MSATSVARAFWLLGIDQPLIASANLLDAIATIRLFFPSEVAQADDALELSLNRRGLATDLASLTEQFDFLKRESLEFWGGSYLLRTRSGELLYLQASNDTLLLGTNNSQLLELPFGRASFSNQTLSFEDDTLSLALKFYFPCELPGSAGLSPGALIAAGEACVTGTVERKGSSAKNHQVDGKRNTCTVEGLTHSGYGDPLTVWIGSYESRYIDGDFLSLDTIHVSADAEGMPVVRYGDIAATSAIFNNNTLFFTLPSDARIAVHLLCAQTGLRTLTGAVLAIGNTRWITGIATTLYASAAQRWDEIHEGRLAAGDNAPDFCSTYVDQQVALAAAGSNIIPAKPYPAIPVTWEDGGLGTIQIEPVQASDIYAVPPGHFVTYHALDANNHPLGTDVSLRVGWLIDKPLNLLSMVEADYYQLRLTFSDWDIYDRAGIHVALARDDAQVPGFISLFTASGSNCAPGSGGASAPVADFTRASTLVIANACASGRSTRSYRLELSGKSTSQDNTAGDHNGFLCARLLFKTSDGAEKMPARAVTIPLLVDADLPIDIRQPLEITGAQTFMDGYIGCSYKQDITVSGGVPPYVWTLPSAPQAGLSWTVSEDAERSSCSLHGTVDGGVSPGTRYSTQLIVLSDTQNVVSRAEFPSVAFTLKERQKEPGIGWGGWLGVASAVLTLGGAGALLARRLYSPNDATKLAPDQRADQQELIHSSNYERWSSDEEQSTEESASEVEQALSDQERLKAERDWAVGQLAQERTKLAGNLQYRAFLLEKYNEAWDSRDREAFQHFRAELSRTDAAVAEMRYNIARYEIVRRQNNAALGDGVPFDRP